MQAIISFLDGIHLHSAPSNVSGHTITQNLLFRDSLLQVSYLLIMPLLPSQIKHKNIFLSYSHLP